MDSVLVVGAGAWGTAIALHADRAGLSTTLWSRAPLVGRRSPHLPGHELPATIRLTQVLEAAPLTLLAVPAQHLRAVASRLPGAGPLLALCKGVETGTNLLPLEILAELHPTRAGAVLGGPNFAGEVAAHLPAAAVIAGTDPALRAALLATLGTPRLRLYGNDDPLGVQLGGAAKNVIAIAAGAVTGAGLGENARAALVTRGLAELSRLNAALGGRPETPSGLSGLGDLLLTCTGPASRNFRHGLALGRGHPPDPAAGVVEGITTAPALLSRAAGIELPICTAVANLVAGRTTVADAIAALLARPLRDE